MVQPLPAAGGDGAQQSSRADVARPLSGSITAAVAAGAFGVYYNSIWALANALHPARLFLAGVIAIVLFTGWLIVRNGLWNSRREVEFPWQGLLDNVTTIIMVSTSVALMYLMIAVGLLGLGLVVIDESLLRSELMRSVGLSNYVAVAWAAASLGMLFGALGSNFDSDDEIREATYSQREYERRQRQDADD